MRRIILHIAAACAGLGALCAQQPAGPTDERVGPVRGEDKGGYNITNSVEFGYRWSLVGGNLGEYRSDVNYRNGLRLLSGSFSIDSKDGHGKYFDQILLNTLGLGNDPYQSATLRVQKNGLYRYDMNWRLNDYYNPGLTVVGGLHLMDTVRRVQDHDVLLFPQSKFRVRGGYSRNTQDGPALSTALQFDSSGVGLPVFMNVRREWNEYRVGGDVDFAGFKFTLLHRWDFFKEDSAYNSLGLISGPQIGVSSDPTVLQSFSRAAPVHGRNPGWLGNLITTHKRWAVNARGSYTRGHNDFSMGEAALGVNRFGSATNRQILVNGDADRPYGAGDLNLSFFPISQLTIINTTSVNSLRINGPSSYTEFNNGSSFGETLYFRYLGIRRITNATDANFRVNKWFGLYGGWHYTDRLVRTVENFSLPVFPGSDSGDSYKNTNILRTGTVGLRIRPIKPVTASVEAEIGRASNPLTPVSDRNYHSINGRADYRTRKVTLSTSYRQIYNVNAPYFYSDFSSHSRNYSASASWAGRDWFSIDASYTKLHLDTTSGIAFFAGGTRPSLQAGTSLYRSNVHAATLAARIAVLKRVDLFVGYSITDDTGDGRGAVAGNPFTSTTVTDIFNAVQTYPLTYQSPFARVSVRISPKLRWNAAYQFYNYGEEIHLFGFNQNFHANTGYTSVLWSF